MMIIVVFARIVTRSVLQNLRDQEIDLLITMRGKRVHLMLQFQKILVFHFVIKAFIEPTGKKKLRPNLEDFDITRVIGKGGFSTVF